MRASFTACISSHLFAVVLGTVIVVNVLSLDAVVEAIEVVETMKGGVAGCSLVVTRLLEADGVVLGVERVGMVPVEVLVVDIKPVMAKLFCKGNETPMEG